MEFVSLFSGAMGLDLGLEAVGFEAGLCVEKDPDAVATIISNKPDIPVLGDIVGVSGEQVKTHLGDGGDLAMVSGGPPCQSFSVFGKRKGIDDLRGQMVFEFVRMVGELRPHTFVMENVRGLLSMPVAPRSERGDSAAPEFEENGSLLRLIFEKFEEIGYRVDCFVVNAVNYGAPQLRERLILIGNRHGLVADFPPPRYSNRPEDGLPPFTTLGDVIGPGSDFEDTCPESVEFSQRKLKYLSMVPAGGNWRSLPLETQKESMGKSWYLKGGRSAYWRRLSFSFPSPTVVTMPNHAGTSMCHPVETRAITVGEAAAIQEFPGDWRFSGNTAAKMRQIGNAVPVRLGQIAGEAVKTLLARIESGESEKESPSAMRSCIVHLRPHVRTRSFWKNGQAMAGDGNSYYETNSADPAQTRLPV